MFLLGSTNGKDSNVDTYHWDEYMDSGSEQMQCVTIGFANRYSSSYDVTSWWLRSGLSTGHYAAICVQADGGLNNGEISFAYAIRPAFVLNLA